VQIKIAKKNLKTIQVDHNTLYIYISFFM
jgi:hypothetical protein